jgi:negative elongation factor A
MSSKDDTALWLHNKLGSTTHLWSFSSTVVSQYSLEKLQSIRDCFVTLDSLVKMKFFLSLFYVPKRLFEEFKPIVHEIIENTIQTCLDQWVLSIATFVQTYWLTQSLNTINDYDLESFKESYVDLKRILNDFVKSESGPQYAKLLLPIEFDYLNRNACAACLPINTSISNEILTQLSVHYEPGHDYDMASIHPTLKSHFSLNTKSTKVKTSQLEELKVKAAHYSKSKTTKTLLNSYSQGLNSANSLQGEDLNMMSSTNGGGGGLSINNKSSVPYLGRFMSSKNDSFSSSYNGGSSSFFKRSMLTTTHNTTITGKSSNLKRDVGIKLLDVQEQSASPKEAKRKRKEQEKEVIKKLKQEQLESEQLKAQQEQEQIKLEREEKQQLDNSNIPLTSTTTLEIPHLTPNIAIPAYSQQITNLNLNDNSNNNSNGMEFTSHQHSMKLENFSTNTSASGFNPNFNPNNNQNIATSQANILNSIKTNCDYDYKGASNYALMHQQPLESQYYHQQQQQQQQSFLNNEANLLQSNFLASMRNNQLHNYSSLTNTTANQQQPHQQQQQQQPIVLQETRLVNSQIVFDQNAAASMSSLASSSSSASSCQTESKRTHQSLSLTREQMLQAQEMFSNSNKLTRPEKALILGFIAGSRENPRPDHGPIILIKLYEAEETLSSMVGGEQQKVLSEFFFQMNYDTGEYKKIKKCKPLG